MCDVLNAERNRDCDFLHEFASLTEGKKEANLLDFGVTRDGHL